MAGHSKWKQIKRKKAITDAKRASSWTKVIREITVAARSGGGDPAAIPAFEPPSTRPRRSTCRAKTSTGQSRKDRRARRQRLRGADLRGLWPRWRSHLHRGHD